MWKFLRRHNHGNRDRHCQTFASAFASALAHTELGTCTCILGQKLIQDLCDRGHLEKAIDVVSQAEFPLTDKVYFSLLRACNKSKSSFHARFVYFHLLLHVTRPCLLLQDYLVMSLAKCGAVDDACQVFSNLDRRTVYSWTALISAFVDCDRVSEAFQTYCNMQEDGIDPDNYTYVVLLRACGCIAHLEEGKRLHAESRRRGFGSDPFICNTLVSMYGRCGVLDEAEIVFYGMSKPDIVSWCSLLCAYVDNCKVEKALNLYRHAQMEGVYPDSRMYVFTLQACNLLADKEEAVVSEGQLLKSMSLEVGRSLHSDIRHNGFMSDMFVCTALVGMYGKCHAIAEAENVFSSMSEHRLVSWNAMLTAYVELGQGNKALQLYRQVLRGVETLDDVTLLCILQAASETGFVEICKHLHFEVVSAGLDHIRSVAATLIHAYGCSASIANGQVVFNELEEPHIAAWNASIAGHAGQGNPWESFQLFETMKSTATVEPDEVTFLLILSACSHNGLVLQALQYFSSMVGNYSLTPDLRHYGIMANLLGRAGNFRLIGGMLDMMPMPANLTIWLCLLGACRLHGNLAIAVQAFRHAVQLQPTHATAYILMSNIYGDAGLHKFADDVEQLRRERCGGEAYLDEDGQDVEFSV